MCERWRSRVNRIDDNKITERWIGTNETRWRCGWFDFGPIQSLTALDWKRDMCYVANTTSAVRLMSIVKPWMVREMKTKAFTEFFFTFSKFIYPNWICVGGAMANCPWYFDFPLLHFEWLSSVQCLHPSNRSAVNYSSSNDLWASFTWNVHTNVIKNKKEAHSKWMRAFALISLIYLFVFFNCTYLYLAF